MLNLDGEIVAKSKSSCFKDPVPKKCGDDDDVDDDDDDSNCQCVKFAAATCATWEHMSLLYFRRCFQS